MKSFEMHAYETKTATFVVQHDDVFSLRTDAKAPWLQHACFWLLRKLGAFHREDRETVTRHLIHPDRFMDALYNQNREVFKQMGVGGETLIIGPVDYERLMREEAPNMQFAFRANYNEGPRVMGLKVQLVPWIEGFAILPPEKERW